jgi:hypothetical protein
MRQLNYYTCYTMIIDHKSRSNERINTNKLMIHINAVHRWTDGFAAWMDNRYSVGVALAAGDGGASPAVGVGLLLRRAVGVVRLAALVARHLVRLQRGVADVPVRRLPLRHGPAQGALAAAHLFLVEAHRALPQRPVARLRRPKHRRERRQVSRGGRCRRRRAAQEARRQGHDRRGAEARHRRGRSRRCYPLSLVRFDPLDSSWNARWHGVGAAWDLKRGRRAARGWRSPAGRETRQAIRTYEGVAVCNFCWAPSCSTDLLARQCSWASLM